MVIRFGTTRTVLLVGNLAFKFPVIVSWRLWLCGLLANIQETKFSALSSKLCPVLFSAPLGLMIVMKRATPLSREAFLSKISDAFFIDGELNLPVENKQCSFGILNKQIVAVDYGN